MSLIDVYVFLMYFLGVYLFFRFVSYLAKDLADRKEQ